MIKRTFDVTASALGLLAASPLLLVVMLLVWVSDWRSPLYIAPRVGLAGRAFRMVKLRSMVVNADRSGVSSTSSADQRIIPIGHFIRKYKLDEVTQLWNVLKGDMSLVGPRPQVQAGVDLYTARERELLSVRPGITDFASIVFSDEGEILKDSRAPDRDYNDLIRPWKNRLGLIYVERRTLAMDLRIVVASALAIVSRPMALRMVARMLQELHVPEEVIRVASRRFPLQPTLPPDDTFRTSMTRAISGSSALG